MNFADYRATRRAVLSMMVALSALLARPSVASAQIISGQVDDFQDGTVFNWQEGASPNPPTNIATGGPAGAGDMYLQNISSGTSGAGSKLVMFNNVQWTGNYFSTAVTQITADMANFGTLALHMRLALESISGTRYGSTTPQTLVADGGIWHPVTFNLTASGMSLISGTDPLNTALTNVTQLRVLSAAAGPSFTGDIIAGNLGMDNFRAVAVPEPGSMLLCGLAIVGVASRRRRRLRMVNL